MALGLDNWNIFYECLNIIFLLHPLFLISHFPPSLGTIGIADFKSKTTKWISPFYQKLKSNFGKMAIKKQQIDFFLNHIITSKRCGFPNLLWRFQIEISKIEGDVAFQVNLF